MSLATQERQAIQRHRVRTGRLGVSPTMARATKLQTQKIDEADTDPFGLARAFLNSEGKEAQGRITVRFWRGQWYRYQDGRYVESEEDTMRVELTGYIKTYFDENNCVDRWGYARRVSKA